MSFIPKPKILHRGLKRNELGLTLHDYGGVASTLCAGCGHDSITAAIVQAFFELDMPPNKVAKLSGIGCSSKTTAYFLAGAHGVNAVHGRMPSVASGANAANRDLIYIGVSGDGDSLSIGLGQFAHAIRRNVDMLCLVENNGVYGLTKGQFSASADIGTKAKKGETNLNPPIDPVKAGIAMGASFVARGFSGDKSQLVPLIKAGVKHRGFALIDVLSPCVTFNDHEDSTKSYAHTRQFFHPAVHADFIPPSEEIRASYDEGEAMPVELHDGSTIVLRKADPEYDPTDRARAFNFLMEHQERGQIVTGLLYFSGESDDMHARNATTETALADLEFERLCPGAEALARLQRGMR